MQLAKNPLALPSLIRFGRQSKRAGALLASFLESYLQELRDAGMRSLSARWRRMSGAGTVVEQVRTLGRYPRRCGRSVSRKGIVRVEEVPVPEVGDGEVLIKVAACGVCGRISKRSSIVCGAAANFGTRIGGDSCCSRARRYEMETGRPGDEFSSHSVRGVFLLRATDVFTMQVVQEHGLTAGFTPNGGGFGEYVKAMPWVAERELWHCRIT